MGSELGVGVPESTSFAQALDALKRNGSNVLLVGEPTESHHERVCDRFFGAPESSHQRIVVSTNRSRLPKDPQARTQYLLHPPESTTREETTSNAVTELSVLGMVGREFVERVDQLDSRGDLGPASLRVCVNSLADLLERYDSEVVFRLLHVLTTRTRRSRGMGHYHLPIERETEAVRLFEPLFEAVVSLRTTADGLEHRWYLRDSETTSDWLPV